MKKLTDIPKPAGHLNDAERAMFVSICQMAIDGPGLRAGDVYLAELAAIAYCKHNVANAEVNRTGLAVSHEGKLSVSPYATEMHRCGNDFVKRMLDLRLVRQAESAGKKSAEESEPEAEPETPEQKLAGIKLHRA